MERDGMTRPPNGVNSGPPPGRAALRNIARVIGGVHR
jgi:hypothetical protein